MHFYKNSVLTLGKIGKIPKKAKKTKNNKKYLNH